MARKTDTDMTRGVIWKLLVQFSVPMMIGLLFQQLYNTVDAMVVGRFCSTEALAAVSCNGNIINVLVGTFAGLATGASVVISQAYGSHDDERLSKAVHTTAAITLILCVAGTVIGILTANPLLALTKPDPAVVEDAQLYLKIYFAGLTGLLIYNVGSGVLRAVGDSTRPVYFLIVSAVTNTILDIVFVVWFDMGVAGVAWATVIAELVSALLVIYVLVRAKAAYGIRVSKIRIDRPLFKQILALGLPSAIQTGITSFSNVFVQSYINSFNAAGMAAWGIYNKLDAFVCLPMQALSMASSTFVGQNWGAGLIKRAKEGVSSAVKLSLIITASLAVIAILFKTPLLRIFSDDADVLDYGRYFINIITPFYVIILFNNIYSGALRGIGDAKTPTVIMLLSFVAFRQLYLFTFCKLLGFEGNRLVISLAYPVGWIMCSTLINIYYRKSALCKN